MERAVQIHDGVINKYKTIVRKNMAWIIKSGRVTLPSMKDVNEGSTDFKFQNMKELYQHIGFVASKILVRASVNVPYGIVAATNVKYHQQEAELIGMEQYRLVAVEPSFDDKDSVDAIRIDSENYISFRYYFEAIDSNKLDKLYDLRRDAVIKLFGKKVINTTNEIIKSILKDTSYAGVISKFVATELKDRYKDAGIEFGSW